MNEIHLLEELIGTLRSQINSIRQQDCNSRLVLTIGSTASAPSDNTPYLTPIRRFRDGYCFGAIVFTQDQAVIIAKTFDGLVDAFLVDSEKKIKAVFNPDRKARTHFGIAKEDKSDSVSSVEFGNISAACTGVVQKSRLGYYKANDLTVDAVFYFLNFQLGELSGKTVVIYGTGNIGNKLSLKLVEAGCEVIAISNNPYEASQTITSINAIKNRPALSQVKLSQEPLHAANNADALLGCTNNVQVISPEMVSVMSPNGVVIDVGRGTIFETAYKHCLENGIKVWAADIAPALTTVVESYFQMYDYFHLNYGKTEILPGVFMVSGGYPGKKYDIVVDAFCNPTSIIGVCDGAGKLMKNFDQHAKKHLAAVERKITPKL